MVVVNLSEAIQHARADVAEVGANFVYNPGGEDRCFYVSQQDPRFPSGRLKTSGQKAASGSKTHACQVGRILTRAGMMTHEIASCSFPATRVAFNILSLDDDVANFLNEIQNAQDQGASAGNALAKGLRVVVHTGR
jgi:hypothetical protein